MVMVLQWIYIGVFFIPQTVDNSRPEEYTTTYKVDYSKPKWKRERIDMDTNKIMLQPSEWIIMEKLWEMHPKTLMQLYHELKVEPGWSKSTVTTLLGRMVDKGILYYEEGGKAKQYYPKVNRDDAAITETESLLERVYKGSVSMMMSTLIRNNNISEADMEELYQILGEALENDD